MRRCLLLLSAAMVFFVASPRASAQAEPYLGQVLIVSFNFPPKGWAMCNGQIMPINQNQALFSLLGTTYGGDGITTFALPDLQGRVPLGQGSGAGLTPYVIGETGGVETVTLTIAQIPAHTHVVMGQSSLGTLSTPFSSNGNGNVWATQSRLNVYSAAVPDTPMAPGAITTVGGSQPHDNRSPYLTLNYIIALQGIFPSRN
jgi:microcystin-dependent protein